MFNRSSKRIFTPMRYTGNTNSIRAILGPMIGPGSAVINMFNCAIKKQSSLSVVDVMDQLCHLDGNDVTYVTVNLFGENRLTSELPTNLVIGEEVNWAAQLTSLSQHDPQSVVDTIIGCLQNIVHEL